MFKKSVLAVSLSLILGGNAFASEEANCGCLTPNVVAGNNIGNIVSSQGDVFMSTSGGFRAVAGGEGIPRDAEIMVGCQAVAQIKVGQKCDLALSAGSQVQIVSEGQNLCVRAIESSNNCGANTTSGSGEFSSAKSQTDGGPGIGPHEFLLFGILGAGTGCSFLCDDAPGPASP